MRASQYDIQQILAADGVIALRRHPGLRGAIEWRVRTGELTAVLPGVYAPADQRPIRANADGAVGVWDATAVLTHEAAAASSFWPELAVPVVRCTVRHERSRRARDSSSLATASRRSWSGLDRADVSPSPALTALDLCASLGGDAIDQRPSDPGHHTAADCMRRSAITAGRHGNPGRRELLLDSRDEPWSAAERRMHRLLRLGGDHRLESESAGRHRRVRPTTSTCSSAAMRLVIEIDGREYHIGKEVFESDRWRQNLLVLDGWRVLRFTWR